VNMTREETSNHRRAKPQTDASVTPATAPALAPPPGLSRIK
jgi:hypothetical protein